MVRVLEKYQYGSGGELSRGGKVLKVRGGLRDLRVEVCFSEGKMVIKLIEINQLKTR